MRIRFLVLILIALFSSSATAQHIVGVVVDQEGRPVLGASVSLRSATDSTLTKLEVTDHLGKYRFSNIPDGKYFVTVTEIGMDTAISEVFQVKNKSAVVQKITLAKHLTEIGRVVVESRKPLIEVKSDKTILNVENSINAIGHDALELLRKSPGVVIDKDDNISLLGKSGVQVYIEGKPIPLSGADLADYLRGIQSSEIATIEIITDPSAKYEAAGNAGIIQIRLKVNKSFGTSGSVNAGYIIGIYPKYNGAFSLNHRNKKVNFFGSYNFNWIKRYSVFNLDRTILDSTFKQVSFMWAPVQTHSFKSGLDYTIGKHSVLGMLIYGNYMLNKSDNPGVTDLYYDPTNTYILQLVSDNKSKSNRFNTNYNINYRYSDTTGRELDISADYGRFRITSNQDQPNRYNDANGNFLYDIVYNMSAPTNIDIYSGKVDYEQHIGKGKIEMGTKISDVESFNFFNRFNVYGNVKVKDTSRSNDFMYYENINALYANYSRQFRGLMFQVGLRVENTNTRSVSSGFKWVSGSYIPYDSSFRRHYTDFFPSASVTLNKNPENILRISLSRRIDRPAYQDLNPFEFKVDEYSFLKGNTNLKPQYTNSISVSHIYKNRLSSTLSYSHVNNIFSSLIDTIDASRSFITKRNLASQDIIGLNISYPFSHGWYNLFANLNTYYTHYKANLGPGRLVNLGVYAYNINIQQAAKLGRGFTAEVSGFFNSPSIWISTFRSKAIWAVDAGIQKSFLNNGANLKLSVSDIFKSIKWAAVSDFAGQHVWANGKFDSRQFKISFSYRFGNRQMKDPGQRRTGVEEESKRVSTQQSGGLGNQ